MRSSLAAAALLVPGLLLAQSWENVATLEPGGRITLTIQKSHRKTLGKTIKGVYAASDETSITLDDTPIHIYMGRIHDRLKQRRQLRFSEMFEPGMHKSAMVGIFLAILELVRHHDVRTEQIGDHGDIQILPGENFDSQVTIDESVDF